MSLLSYFFQWYPITTDDAAGTAEAAHPLEDTGAADGSEDRRADPFRVGEPSYFGTVAPSDGAEHSEATLVATARSLFPTAYQMREAGLTGSAEVNGSDHAH